MTTAEMEKATDEHRGDDHDEEKGLLDEEGVQKQGVQPMKVLPTGLSRKFWIASAVNCLSTASIVFVNKRIFEHKPLRHAQVAFAAFHFAFTAATLYTISRPQINMFQVKRVQILRVLPLATAMILNVVLLNASLASSSILFYQMVRVLNTPSVAALNWLLSKTSMSIRAALALIPICLGVAIVSYSETVGKSAVSDRTTSTWGVVFAFSALISGAIYTVWIGQYHKILECSSMQLLLNQTPVSVLVMLYVIPLADDVTAWKTLDLPTWLLVLLSGLLACFINISQFVIINEAGAVSSTVVSHFKNCCIIVLGWFYSRKPLKDGSVVGIILAIGGIVAYTVISQRELRK